MLAWVRQRPFCLTCVACFESLLDQCWFWCVRVRVPVCARVCPTCSQYDRVAGSLADRRAAKGRGPDREYTEEEMEAMRAKAEKERNQVMMNVRGEPRIAG